MLPTSFYSELKVSYAKKKNWKNLPRFHFAVCERNNN